jgi:signal recognition particle receptor subunit beta
MALFNYATKELSVKIVYYGPGLSGKTTNIEMVHRILRPEQKGRLISLPTETDRTLFFDFLPVELGQIKGFKVRFHLYTVPGQVFYNATRRLVLQGVDGVVFIADSQADMKQSNLESLKNLMENLASYGKKLEELPFVIQYNKRDLRQILPVQQLNALLNPRNVPAVEGIAKNGVGISETLVTISRMVFSNLRKSLLMPGDEAEHKEVGDLTEEKIRQSLRPREAEPLEEISDIEEITEVREALPAEEEPAPLEAVGFVIEEIEIPVPVDSVPDEIEIEIPEPAPVPPAVEEPSVPQAAAVAPGESEILHGPTPAGGEPVAPGREVPESPDEIDIEVPEPAPVPPPARESRVGVALETEAGGITFLKFETPYIAPEGHAVLPAVFMDDRGNIVRLRIRITMEERG